MLPDSIRKFRHTAVEPKESIRKELAQEYEHYIAQGRMVTVLPGPSFKPKPIAKPKMPPKPLQKRVLATIKNTQWTDMLEIEKLRQLRSCGHTCASIASILNAQFDNDRTPEGVKSALQRDREGTLGARINGIAWSKEEESWLYFLAKEGFYCREIAEAMTRFLGHRNYNPGSIRQYAKSRSVKIQSEKAKHDNG